MNLKFLKTIKYFTIILIITTFIAGNRQCKAIKINEDEENTTNTCCCCEVMKRIFRNCFKNCKKKQLNKKYKLYINDTDYDNQLFMSYIDILANKNVNMDKHKHMKEISESMDLSLYEM